MPWLDVPHIRQSDAGWCLPACVSMVAAYWQQPLLQEDVARWLGATGVGTPASRVQRLSKRGFDVVYRTGSLAALHLWIERGRPCILFVHTRDLSYWDVATPHAVVLAGFDGEDAVLFDPGIETAPVMVSTDELLLAWSHFDYTFAVLYVSQ